MSEHDDFGSFLVGFVIGGLTGAVVALLFAPQSGEETRTVIKEKGYELRDRASQTAEETLARAEKAASDAKARYDELAEEVKSRGQDVLLSAKKAVSKKKPGDEATS